MSLRLTLAMLSLAIVSFPAEGQSGQAGFERQVTADGTEVGIWYPATGTPVHQRLGLYAQDVVPDAPVPSGKHPLIIISHGTGGDYAGHVDTAVALARAGFIVAALIPLGRMARVEEVAAAALFLLSDEAGFVTGAELCVDGGMRQV